MKVINNFNKLDSIIIILNLKKFSLTTNNLKIKAIQINNRSNIHLFIFEYIMLIIFKLFR